MFVDREIELNQLHAFKKRKMAGLVVCRGRRRIGKSALVKEFASQSPSTRFIEFFGLAPRPDIDNQAQLDHFSEQLALAFNIAPIPFTSWNQAFDTLAAFTSQGEILIFFDEISWMGGYDPDFVGKLKGAWDNKFKQNPNLILILCGSVTSWIEENILKDKGFVGRISLIISLDELPLHSANCFWPANSQISANEKFRLLCITGGIPRYLEEIQTTMTAEHNIKRLCFSKAGLLFNEFDSIFNDIFGKRAQIYKQMLYTLLDGALEASEICEKMNADASGIFFARLEELVLSGFISRDYVWQHNKRKRFSKFRLRDNYVRFYLKYIEPRSELIKNDIFTEFHLEDLPGWKSILGLQFENLVLNNLKIIIQQLAIPPSSILSAAPYFQHKTNRQQACQIDLLIQTKQSFYLCEIKFKQEIGVEVIEQVQEKVKKLKPLLKGHSVRPVLIYQGELTRNLITENYFNEFISFATLLIKPST